MGEYFKHKKARSGYLLCVVPLCQTKKSTTTLKTFEFPSDLKRRSQWISAIVEATLKNEEKSSLEDLYALENRRMELEMEVSEVLGDHSYVCARHFSPEDIIVHRHVCRLTPNAVPSVFSNYTKELPRQFFKKICQTARSMNNINNFIVAVDDDIQEDESEEVFDVNCSLQAVMDDENINKENKVLPNSSHEMCTHSLRLLDNCTNLSSDVRNDATASDVCTKAGRAYLYVSRGTNTKLKYTGVSNIKLSRNKLKKKLRLLEMRCKNLKKRLEEIENKHELYNIRSLENDAENNNEEASFLLDMLRSYTVFEKTRNEILTAQKIVINA